MNGWFTDSARARACRTICTIVCLFASLGPGCSGSKLTPGSPEITATPNPVAAGSGKGTTQISWNTGDGLPGQVYVSRDGKPEQVFSQGAKGSQEAPWIQAGTTYEFRLYAGKEHSQLLASVEVRGDRK
jgi:hypothetical protein